MSLLSQKNHFNLGNLVLVDSTGLNIDSIYVDACLYDTPYCVCFRPCDKGVVLGRVSPHK